jgi:hypothetical protein
MISGDFVILSGGQLVEAAGETRRSAAKHSQ